VAGLSILVGELAVAAKDTARRGEPARALDSLIAGASLDWVRLAPPRASWLDGLSAGADRLGCVRVAAALAAAVCLEMLAEDGPGLALAAVCGPALAGTSATVVTTFAIAFRVLRLEVATTADSEPALGVLVLESLGEADRRDGLGARGDSVAADAI
jgi:hypothetical protein